jgi:hypothetical protein
MILGKKITSTVISPMPNAASKIGSSTNHRGRSDNHYPSTACSFLG